MKVRFYALAVVVALLPLSGFTLSKLDGLSVKRQPKEGQVLKLTLKGDFEIQGMPAQLTGMADEKTTKVADDGSYTIEEQQHDLKASFNGQDVPVEGIQAVSTVFNPDGSVREILGGASVATPEAYRLVNLGLIVDSGKPLNVGDTWTYAIKADPKTGVVDATANYKLVSEEKVGDIDTLKVQVTVKETSGAEPASSDGFWWIDKGDGSVVKSEVIWTNAPFPGVPFTISGKLSMMRAGT